MQQKLIVGVAAALIAAALPGVAFAGTTSATMAVAATVLEACTVTATPMSFGNVVPGSSNVDSSATLQLVCTPNADYDILLNNGSNASAGQRRLANAGSTEFIPYNVFLDSNYSQPWGNSVGVNTKAGVAGATGLASYPVYGRIPATATPVTAGAYTDTVTVTVNF